jgi:hypothetical protein
MVDTTTASNFVIGPLRPFVVACLALHAVDRFFHLPDIADSVRGQLPKWKSQCTV